GYVDVPQRQKSRSSSNSSTSRMSGSIVVQSPPSLRIPINQTDSSSFPTDRPHHPEPISPTTTHPTTPIPTIDIPSLDDRPLPALSKINPNPPIPTSPLSELNDNQPEELSDLARSAFDVSIQYFGEYDIACLLSKKFPLRESALANVTNRIDVDHGNGKEIEGNDKVGIIKAAFQIIQEALNDNPEKLTLQALNLWETLTKFCIHHQ
ncbi:19704_t:CDS:2, partial [Racocetra persica]